MIFQRKLLGQLIQWHSQKGRKPLILRGARQVGKTSLVTHFGQNHFKNCIIINFETDSSVRKIFETQDDVVEILKQIEVIKNTSIIPEETLLFLDEIQVCPAAIGKLRYFFEKLPRYPVIAAGSLLEFALDEETASFPVGRVQFLYLYPLNFQEYLLACGEKKLHEYLQGIHVIKPIPEAIHDKLKQQLKNYFLTGGMPEVVSTFLGTNSIQRCQEVMVSLLQTAQEDFRKYRTRFDPHHLEHVFRNVPKWIGKRVNLTKLGESELGPTQVMLGIRLLAQAMLVYRVNPVSSLQFPLCSKPKIHPKLIFLDVGLAQNLNRVSQEIISARQLSSVYEGGLAEQFVAQEILSLLGEKTKPEIFFWISENKKSTAEVDFIYPCGGTILPVEVKSGGSGRLASLHRFCFLHRPPLAIRIYDGPLTREKISLSLSTSQKVSYSLLSVPLYLTGQLSRILEEIFSSS